MIKKILAAALAAAMLFSMAACGASPKYKDGTYTAESADFDAESGWKDVVTISVAGGKITQVDWNATHKDGGLDKKAMSESGEYGMKAGGAKSEWHEQAQSMESQLVNDQDPAKIKVNAEGRPDAVSGVSIHVSEFVKLSKEALEKAK